MDAATESSGRRKSRCDAIRAHANHERPPHDHMGLIAGCAPLRLRRWLSARSKLRWSAPISRFFTPAYRKVVNGSDSTQRLLAAPEPHPVMTAFHHRVSGLVFVMELVGGQAFVTRGAPPGRHRAGPPGYDSSSMFMHASWSHILGTMVFLWASEESKTMAGGISFSIPGWLAATAGMVGPTGLDRSELGASGRSPQSWPFLVTTGDRIAPLVIFIFVGVRYIRGR